MAIKLSCFLLALCGLWYSCGCGCCCRCGCGCGCGCGCRCRRCANFVLDEPICLYDQSLSSLSFWLPFFSLCVVCGTKFVPILFQMNLSSCMTKANIREPDYGGHCSSAHHKPGSHMLRLEATAFSAFLYLTCQLVEMLLLLFSSQAVCGWVFLVCCIVYASTLSKLCPQYFSTHQ